MSLANATIKEIFQDKPRNFVKDGDIFLFFDQQTNETVGILVQDLLPETSDEDTNFSWVQPGASDPGYSTGDVAVYLGEWYISNVNNNKAVPTNTTNWTRENKISAISIPDWSAGIVDKTGIVRGHAGSMYRVKSTATIPFNSNTNPATDTANWELFPTGGGIDPSAIVNDFSTDPDDTDKVAGANAVYLLFQSLTSDDINYDTLQEIVDFIKTIDTDGELVAAVNAAYGINLITELNAKALKSDLALTTTSGTSILFDKARKYGYPTAETGNITFDFTDAVEGVTQVMRHNSGTKPTMPASAKKLSGDYTVSVDNIIYLTAYKESTGPDVWKVDVTVAQEETW